MIKDVILWLYWNPFRYIVQRLPARQFYWLTALLSGMYYRLSRGKRWKYERELVTIMGEQLTPHERQEIVKQTCFLLVCNELEVLLFPMLDQENIASYVKVTGIEHLDCALSEGNGAMLLLAHFGANQMVMPAVGCHDYRMSQLSAPATAWKQVMPERVFSRIEEQAMNLRWQYELSLPVEHINIFGSLKKAFRCLQKNHVLGIAIDGGWGEHKAAVDFFRQQALFSIGAVDIARRTGCVILPTFMIRDMRSGQNTMIIEAPLPLEEGTDSEEIAAKTTQRFAAILERYVKTHPAHYLHFLALRRMMAERGDSPFWKC